MRVGLRIDVDTWRGTRSGVPDLVARLARHGILATFFFSVGPDNMGRHLWRLLRPTFLWKMLRSDAAGLYGWDILLRGTLWPGARIGAGLGDVIARAAARGHEAGFHAWDHHAWQAHLERYSVEDVRRATGRGVEALTSLCETAPTTSACAGWRCNDLVLRTQLEFDFAYQSDCRGTSVFLPEVDGQVLDRPQVPVTLPTYDELIGRDGVDDSNYNQRLLARLDTARLNVLTIHAEVEGVARRELFEDFLVRAHAAGWEFVPLSELIPSAGELPVARVVQDLVPGREGQVACQGPTLRTQRWEGRPRAAQSRARS